MVIGVNMKKRLFLYLLFVGIIAFLAIHLPSLFWKKWDFTKEELENGLLGVELIYINGYDDGYKYDIVCELSKEEEQYVINEITKIHFWGSAPHEKEKEYGIKFCYEEWSLLFEPFCITKIYDNGEELEGIERLFMDGSSMELNELISYLMDRCV